MTERPPLRVGISCADLNGIGIEVVLKCFEDSRMLADLRRQPGVFAHRGGLGDEAQPRQR